MKNLPLLLCLILPYFVLAQQRLSGRLTDAKDGTPLAYVNVGVLGAGIGTVSDPDGRFSLRIPRGRDGQVKLSLLGYRSKTFTVRELADRLGKKESISLQPQVYDLSEVVVVPSFTKTKTIGNPARQTRLTDGFDGNALGREGGVIVKLKQRYRPAKVLKFQLFVNNSSYEEIKFRINFYSVKDKYPDRPLPQESVIVTSKVRNGILEADLEDYGIVVTDDFALTLEWIEDFGPGDLQFCFRRFGPRCVFRYASQDDWESYSGLLAPSPQMNVTVGYN
ncbi:MAG: carboxypeptidase-like regulatory domain-containing protein [Bacteroidota bacterium]